MNVKDTGFLILNEIKHFPIKGDETNCYKTTYIPYWLIFNIYKNKEKIKKLAEEGGIYRKEFLQLLGKLNE